MRISFSSRCTRTAPLTALLIAAALTAGGCKKEIKPEPQPAESASEDPNAEVNAFLEDDKVPLTKPIYRKLLENLASCKLTERGIEPKCSAYQDLRKARNRKTSVKEMRAMNTEVGKELIQHEHPAVRLQAAKLLQSTFETDPGVQKAIIDAATKEKEPSVLAAMLRTVGAKLKTNPEVKTLVLRMADSPSEAVRRESLNWFLTTYAEGVEGTFDKVLEKMEKDPSEEVRSYLCNRLYGSSDPRALDVFKKYLEAEDTPKKIYNACWNGLINSWTGFPKPRKPLKEGYELTMKILEKTPRTAERPAWSGISTLRSAKTEYSDTDRFGKEWLDQVKDWYKADRLLKALKAIATDTNANWMARTAALRVMHELDEPKATFTTLLAKYKEATAGDDFHVKRQLEDILRKYDMPKPEGSGDPRRPRRPGMPSELMMQHGATPRPEGPSGAPPPPPPAPPAASP